MRIEVCLLGALVIATAGCGKGTPLDPSGGAGGMTPRTGTGGAATGASGAGGTVGGAGATGVSGGGGTAGSAGTTGAGGGGGAVDPAALCSAWTADLTAQNQSALELNGFFNSRAILEGTLGARFDEAGSSWARFTIDKVRAGIAFLEGREVAIAMGPGLHATFGAGASVLVGLSSTRPYMQSGVSLPTFNNLLAIAAKDQVTLPDDVLGFRAWQTPNVVVLRVREVPPPATEVFAFDVIETLAGSLPEPYTLWMASAGPFGARVGDELIAGFAIGQEMVELRPNNADERARALRGIAALAPGAFAPRYRGELEAARAEATRYRLAWTFGRAQWVLGLEVSGLSAECCTGAGGTFFANTVTDLLRGTAPAGPVLTGGHGVYNDETCGERYLYAMRSLATLTTGELINYGCPRGTQTSSVASSGVDARLPATAADRADVDLWLRSAPALLRMFPPTVSPPADAFAAPTLPAVWSVPTPAITALQARHHLALMTIVGVQPQPGGGHSIRVSTPFWPRDLPSMTIHQVSLHVPCADPRLLQVGRRWVGAVMGVEPFSGSTGEAGTQLALQRLMLIPGFLLPGEREDLVRTAEEITEVAIPRPFAP
jgi:hypothetical protein